MRPYSKDLRKRVVEARASGLSAAKTAERFSICKRSVERYWARYQQSGSYESYQQGGHRQSRLHEQEATLRAWIEAEPGLTLQQIKGALRTATKGRYRPFGHLVLPA